MSKTLFLLKGVPPCVNCLATTTSLALLNISATFIEHFCDMKIETATEISRENQYNFTQIADFLGYASIHYFSRQFKQTTGMTPTEYALSVKVLQDHSRQG